MGNITKEIEQILQTKVTANIGNIDNIGVDDTAINCYLCKECDSWNNTFLDRLDTDQQTDGAEDANNFTGNPAVEKDNKSTRRFHWER